MRLGRVEGEHPPVPLGLFWAHLDRFQLLGFSLLHCGPCSLLWVCVACTTPMPEAKFLGSAFDPLSSWPVCYRPSLTFPLGPQISAGLLIFEVAVL